MSLTSYVDAYCERVDPAFWSEPLNALTNAGFALAAWLLWRSLQRSRAQGVRIPPEIAALPTLLLLIAACSFAFHTLALVWAGLADQLSILLFGCVFLFGFLRRVAGLAPWTSLATALLFSLASYFTPGLLPPGFLNQSGAYFPYLVALLGMTIYLWQQERPGWRAFLGATILFCCALTLRTVDRSACALIPVGTHFIWHLLNAIVLFWLSNTLSREALRGR
jgi:hypothetical protein